MGEYEKKQRNQLSRAIANSEIGSRQLKEFVDDRIAMSDINHHYCIQNKSVMQLATRLSSPVVFAGSAYQLEQLILQWGPPAGTRVAASQTDFVGHSYRVRFTNNNGPAISLTQANQWVQNGIAHYEQ